ncbi:ABC transporter substrate-binding protein [Cohnella sp. CIP 111063]|uniref:ABC transporter substrate-binding protein n=1 Tax=unclassified Cohnella TaxID=2636738 RepID=UPI000B8BF8EF|nr:MULTISPECIES: extracellular solute-binding protein [unclassified Cohnella]OXS52664.1 ABC transporter substrate-binding protein [Cohnella sp. CIP 111063]PRX59195.1 raffinose/stachyose/melibiose transport system substrate-binding protein [Cohnella sp. SGD-V74]
MASKRLLKLASGILSASLVLTACGGNNGNSGSSSSPSPSPSASSGSSSPQASQDTPTPVTLSIGYATGDPAGKKAIEDVLDAFSAAYPHITIKNLSETTSDSYLDWLKTKDAVGEFPDVVEMRDTKVFADAGKLAELPEELHGLFSYLPSYEGKYYNAPLSANAPNGILYSKKAYADAGVTELPKTYDEFIAIQEKLLASGTSPIVVGGKDLWHMGFWVNYFLISQVYAKDPDWNSKRTAQTASFTDAQVVQAITDYKELFSKYVDKGWLSTADNQTASILVSGKAAQLFSGPWMIGQILEADPNFELGFYALPDREGKTTVVGLPGLSGWSLSSEAAKDSNKVEAFSAFVKFFFDPAQYKTFIENSGSIPSTSAKMDIEANEIMQQVLAIAADPGIQKSMMINQWYGENAIPPQFRNWYYKLLQELIVNKGDVAEYMKQADAEYDSNVKANQQ